MKKKVLTQRLQRIHVRALIFIMVIVMFIGANPLVAAKTKGVKIKVLMKDGMTFTGDLQAISGRTLVLFDRADEKEYKASIDEVKELRLYKKPDALKGVINGALSGVSMAILASSRGNIEEIYRPFAYGILGALGVGMGALSSILLLPRPIRYPVHKMTAAEIDELLSVLEGSPWSKATEKNWYKNGLLGRLRISWRPYSNHELKMNIRGNSGLTGTPLPNEHVSTTSYLSSSTRWDSAHTGRVRIDYAMRDWISVGVEYFSLEDSFIDGLGRITITQDQEEYTSSTYFWGHHRATILLFGASFGVPRIQETLRGLRLETGIGLSFTNIQIDNFDYYPQWTPLTTQTFDVVKPAFQIGLSLELYPNESFSSGVYAVYLYAPSTFPGFQATGTASFFGKGQDPSQNAAAAFTREATMNFPKTGINANGFSVGFLVRIR